MRTAAWAAAPRARTCGSRARRVAEASVGCRDCLCPSAGLAGRRDPRLPPDPRCGARRPSQRTARGADHLSSRRSWGHPRDQPSNQNLAEGDQSPRGAFQLPAPCALGMGRFTEPRQTGRMTWRAASLRAPTLTPSPPAALPSCSAAACHPLCLRSSALRARPPRCVARARNRTREPAPACPRA